MPRGVVSARLRIAGGTDFRRGRVVPPSRPDQLLARVLNASYVNAPTFPAFLVARFGSVGAMSFLKWFAAGIVGAAAGGAAWVLIGHFANYEVGWIAWGIGFLAGAAVRVVAGDAQGPAPGLAAVAAAAAGVAVSKYVVVALMVNQILGQMQVQKPDFASEPAAIARTADEIIATEYEAAGKEVEWPADADFESDDLRSTYPPEIWTAAERKWNALSDADKQGRREAWVREFDEGVPDVDDIRSAAFAESFTPWELLWFGLAMFTAFRVGSGLDAGSQTAKRDEAPKDETPKAE